MKFKMNNIAILYICLLFVPILINAIATGNTKSSEKFNKMNTPVLSKEEQNKMFDLYANGKVKGEPKEDKLTGGPIYFQGWAKYFHYSNGQKADKPSDFFQNNGYFSQRVLKSEQKKKDKRGFLSIPSKFHFFLTLTRDTLSVVSSRQMQLQKVEDSLQVDLINPIAKDNRTHGGVQRLGEFDEGNCFQILTTTPSYGPDPDFNNLLEPGSSQNWVVCFDDLADRTVLMRLLITIKLIKQKVSGQDLTNFDKSKASLSKLLKPKKTPNIEHYNGPGKDKDKDGFWVLLQDWSQCTLKCGGGLQYQQWVCQKEIKGGKPCQGKPVRTRPCNINKCPSVSGKISFNKKPNEKVFKPIVKNLPWSSRLQRYIQCEVKETDVLYIKRDIPGKEGIPTKFPARMVMTNRTISLYEDDTFDRNIFTFNIMETSFGTYEKDFCCVVLESMDKHFRVCGFNSECGPKAAPLFVPKWIKAFNLFTQKCNVDLPKKNWKKSFEDEDALAAGSHHMQLPGLEAREGIIKRKIVEKQQNEIEKKISSTQELALKAIRKELKLETLVKNEEKIKEKMKIQDLVKLKLKEENKNNCLEKALKEREDENKKGRSSQEAELEIARIKEEAKKDVSNERLNLRKKIDLIKKQGKRKRRMLEQEITMIRSTMARNLLAANKNGDMELCRNGTKDVEKAKEYCDANFVSSYTSNLECKDTEKFCPTCCENEYGNLFLNKRDECYKICDDILKNALKGDWIWAPK